MPRKDKKEENTTSNLTTGNKNAPDSASLIHQALAKGVVQTHLAPLLETKEKPHSTLLSTKFRDELARPLHEDWFEKLLKHVRNHELEKAQAMIDKEAKREEKTDVNPKVTIKNRPRYFTTERERIIYLMTLLETSQQEAARAFLNQHRELAHCKGEVKGLDGKLCNDITPYQYALCLEHIQLQEMLRNNFLTEDERFLEEKEFIEGTNEDMKALHDQYKRYQAELKEAYEFYIYNTTPQPQQPDFKVWTLQQEIDYFTRVIGRLQLKGPEQLRQELFKERDFNAQTNFSDAEAHRALPEARYWDNRSIHPLRTSPEGGKFELLSCEEGQVDSLIKKLSEKIKYNPILICAGNSYFLYAPVVPTEIRSAVNWEKHDIDKQLIENIKPPVVFPILGQKSVYSVPEGTYSHKELYSFITGRCGAIIGSGLSFDFGFGNYAIFVSGRGAGERAVGRVWLSKNLGGMATLFETRTQEQAAALNSTRQKLLAKAGSPAPAAASSAAGKKLGR